MVNFKTGAATQAVELGLDLYLWVVVCSKFGELPVKTRKLSIATTARKKIREKIFILIA
ncbi:hypothetical protein [Chroococcidiopsis sp. SAG 2025]|uniref:hypothetical protein n=1 Tax=Chroococcidiopsis sp. SAG 2025 TaxID=171389 RepID=UPI002936E4E7|nr:hypothetical protein [Chroococcidiopsis sp. SAG 2025]